MKTYVYIDGFNLYHGALKKTNHYKWLNLYALVKNILDSDHDIEKIKYFTARLKRLPSTFSVKNNERKIGRQKAYLKAIESYIPQLEIIEGHFSCHEKSMPLAEKIGDRKSVRVFKTEEKGSDVNLAVHLLNDSWLDRYDCAVVVSNDSDIAESMKLVRARGATVGFISPYRKNVSAKLKKNADFFKIIRKSFLKNAQLPDMIPNTKIRKPYSW